MEVTFTSTKNRASYECLLLDGSTFAPTITRCESRQTRIWINDRLVSRFLVSVRHCVIGQCLIAEVDPKIFLFLFFQDQLLIESIDFHTLFVKII